MMQPFIVDFKSLHSALIYLSFLFLNKSAIFNISFVISWFQYLYINSRERYSSSLFILQQKLTKIDKCMSTIIACCSNNQVYIGLDQNCHKSAVICLNHSAHSSPNGVIHNIMPISHFKQTINQLKFQMADKISSLVDQYSSFMDNLITEITELKLRKVVQFGLLWLRELAKTNQEYQQLKRIFRNDYQGFSCQTIFNLYQKIKQSYLLQKKELKNIPAYTDICKAMQKFANSPKAKLIILQKVSQIQGIIENGQILKRALPDKKIFKQTTKQILLQTINDETIQIRYNKAVLTKGSTRYHSIFSKYPLLLNSNYHMTIETKYTNVLLGVCHQKLKKQKENLDLHYHQQSLTYNCSNGCIYRDGMFQNGPSQLTKGKKKLQLVLKITQTELFILLDNAIVCRTQLQNLSRSNLYLHILLRGAGDSFQIDRDQLTDTNQPNYNTLPKNDVSQCLSQYDNYKIESVQNAVSDSSQVQSFSQYPKIQKPKEFIPINQGRIVQSFVLQRPSVPKLKNSEAFKESNQLVKSKKLLNSMEGFPNRFVSFQQNKDKNDKSNIFINMQSSIISSQQGYTNNCLPKEYLNLKQTLPLKEQSINQQQKMTPMVITPPLKRSIYQLNIKESKVLNQLPKMVNLDKKNSAYSNTQGLRRSQLDVQWL